MGGFQGLVDDTGQVILGGTNVRVSGDDAGSGDEVLAALVTTLRVELAMAIMLQVPAEGLGGRELRHRRDGDVVEFRFNA